MTDSIQPTTPDATTTTSNDTPNLDIQSTHRPEYTAPTVVRLNLTDTENNGGIGFDGSSSSS